MAVPDTRSRVLFVVNKNWEAEQVVQALEDPAVWSAVGAAAALHSTGGLPTRHRFGDEPVTYRARFELSRAVAELWCVSDLMEEPKVADAAELAKRDKDARQSSTQVKAARLAALPGLQSAALLVAVGTAGTLDANLSVNGSVTVGKGVFLHDGHPASNPNADSAWHDAAFHELIPSALSDQSFAQLTDIDAAALSRVLRQAARPVSPRLPLSIIASPDNVAVSKVNVTDYHEYDAVELTAASEFECWRRAHRSRVVGASMETTHGLLRVLGPAAFMFISGIVSRLGRFNDDVTLDKQTSLEQNAPASFNAGVVMAAVIARLDSIH